MYDPINPDKDTIETRRWNPREREDNEFELMGKLDLVMEKANFYELPKDVIERALKEHTAMDGIRVGHTDGYIDMVSTCVLIHHPYSSTFFVFFSPRYCKYEHNTTSYWLNFNGLPIKSCVTFKCC